jgi:phospholipid-binding lipoprotein MlaA
LAGLVLSGGCASRQEARHAPGVKIYAPRKPVSQYVKKDVGYAIDAYDPWECFNRDIYLFNYYFDKYLFLPVVGAYKWIMPDYLEQRVSGILQNFGELKNLTNNILQLKPKPTAITTGRVLVNTTIGLAGMYDPASKMGLPTQNEDFGQTLGYYGVGPGPYLVLPIFGPSTLRDTTGLAVDASVRAAVMNWATDDLTHQSEVEAAINLTDSIDTRRRTPFRYYQSGSPFEYDFVRKLYLEKRTIEIAK